MKKEFIEYQNLSNHAPNKVVDISSYLLMMLRKYLKENPDKLENGVTSRILMDALGEVFEFLLSDYRLRFGENENKSDILDKSYIITLLVNVFLNYSFKKENYIIKEMEQNGNKIAEGDIVSILVNFINYVLKENGYERTFRQGEFYKSLKERQYKEDMFYLKRFLSSVSIYYGLLKNSSIDDLLDELFEIEGINHISKNGNIYYNVEKRINFGTEMSKEKSLCLMEKIDIMAYAYYKYMRENGSTKASNNKIIHSRIKKMKQREVK